MSSSLIDAILDRFGIGGGDLTVLASREGRDVVRIIHPTGDFVVKAASLPGAFDEEARAMQTLGAIGIPVSRLVAVERGPPAFLIATWAEGQPISADSDPVSLRAAGAILRRIHALPASGPWSSHPTIAAWIENWLGIVTRWWEKTGLAGPVDIVQARAWMDDVRQILMEDAGCQMLFDGRPDHFLAGVDGRIRLIDVADLQPGSAAMDLAVLELDAPGILGPVLDGYAPDPGERVRFDRVVPFYVLLRALAAAEWQERVVRNSGEARRYLSIAQDVLAIRRGVQKSS